FSKIWICLMENSSLRSLGAKVVVVSSSDEKHPPENIIDGNTESFWMSTGLFPQEFIIGFTHSTNISAVTMDSYNVLVQRHKCFDLFFAINGQFLAEFDHVTGCLQSNTLPVSENLLF
uniref:Heat shock protein, alpha-crystallin-related, b11 n=1 Tax=Takifugu rubripes TaxID=31033 RepID=A0A674NG79_TAKRU